MPLPLQPSPHLAKQKAPDKSGPLFFFLCECPRLCASTLSFSFSFGADLPSFKARIEMVDREARRPPLSYLSRNGCVYARASSVHSLNVRPHRPQLLHNPLISAINVIHAIDHRLSARHQPC
jgi:hypothetical protein